MERSMPSQRTLRRGQHYAPRDASVKIEHAPRCEAADPGHQGGRHLKYDSAVSPLRTPNEDPNDAL
jgi:hypothetical protein